MIMIRSYFNAKIAVFTVLWLSCPLAAEGARIQPFSQFVHGVEAARARAYLDAPGTAVKRATAFDEMRRYLLRLYRGITVGRSFEQDGQIFDCVPIDQQPAIRRQGSKHIAAPPPTPPSSLPEGASAPNSNQPIEATFGAPHCGRGTIPMLRVTLATITRFATLQDFLAKEPAGPAPGPPANLTTTPRRPP